MLQHLAYCGIHSVAAASPMDHGLFVCNLGFAQTARLQVPPISMQEAHPPAAAAAPASLKHDAAADDHAGGGGVHDIDSTIGRLGQPLVRASTFVHPCLGVQAHCAVASAARPSENRPGGERGMLGLQRRHVLHGDMMRMQCACNWHACRINDVLLRLLRPIHLRLGARVQHDT